MLPNGHDPSFASYPHIVTCTWQSWFPSIFAEWHLIHLNGSHLGTFALRNCVQCSTRNCTMSGKIIDCPWWCFSGSSPTHPRPCSINSIVYYSYKTTERSICHSWIKSYASRLRYVHDMSTSTDCTTRRRLLWLVKNKCRRVNDRSADSYTRVAKRIRFH